MVQPESAPGLQEIISKAEEFNAAHPGVVIDNEALRQLAESIDPQACAHPHVGLPLKFDNDMQEVNLHATVALLSFGAHFEREERLENSARDTVLYGIIGLHISKKDLDASHYRSISRSDITEYFGINCMELVRDEKVPIAQVEKPGKLSGLVDDLVKVLEETGDRLGELSCVSLARFILDALKSEPTAARLVSALPAAFPHFRDQPPEEKVQEVRPPMVQTYKKALMLAAELYHGLRDRVPSFAFADYASLPPYVTPAIVNLLVDKAVLRPAEGRSVDDLVGPEQAPAVVASALVALSRLRDQMVEQGAAGLAAADLSFYLDGKAAKEQQEQCKAQAPRWNPGRSTTW